VFCGAFPSAPYDANCVVGSVRLVAVVHEPGRDRVGPVAVGVERLGHGVGRLAVPGEALDPGVAVLRVRRELAGPAVARVVVGRELVAATMLLRLA
jgi:hypothetical protein